MLKKPLLQLRSEFRTRLTEGIFNIYWRKIYGSRGPHVNNNFFWNIEETSGQLKKLRLDLSYYLYFSQNTKLIFGW